MIPARCRKPWAADGVRPGGLRLSEFIQQKTKRVCGELRAMKRCRRQPAQSFGDSLSSYRTGCCDSTARQTLCQDGGAGDRCRASAAQKTRFGDYAILDANRQLQRVAANRIRRLNFSRGIRQLAGVARIPKVVQHEFVVHRTILAQVAPLFST